MDINWNGDYFYGAQSHANINRGIVLGLLELGHRVSVSNITDTIRYNPKIESHKIINSLTKNKFDSDYNIFKFGAIHMAKEDKKWNCVLHSDGSYASTEHINKLLRDNPINYLWLPTPDCAEVVNLYTPVPTVGLGIDSGIDPTRFNPRIAPYNFKLLNNPFKFLIGCDGASKTRLRPAGGFRGSDIGIRAFIEEFTNKDNVCLIVKIGHKNQIINLFIDKLLASKLDAPKIIKDYGFESQITIAAKLRACDCTLSPIRDCRWEATILEGLGTGTPSIATGQGGPKMYGEKGVYFVKYKIVDGDLHKSRRNVAVGRDIWREPSCSDFGKKMRYVFEHQSEARDFGLEGSEHVIKNWKWIDISKRIINFFNEN